ncbi:MAG: sensor domain-containing phosphodiesterase [Microthrixaceae bacterium]|nr:sensor domain-containing phosphodiesterase [Microthrixaceae bacterium]
MVASAPLPLAVLDADGAVVASSRSMAANLARPVEELIGRPLRSLVRTGDALLLVEALRAARDRPDSPTSLVIGLDRADGVSARVDLTISALADGWAVYLRPPQLRSDTTLDLGTSARSATISPHRLGSLAQWQLAIHELITLGASPEVILDHVARLVDHHLSATCVITLKGTDAGRWNTSVVAAPGVERLVGLRAPALSPDDDPAPSGAYVKRLGDIPMFRQLLAGEAATVLVGLDPDTNLWAIAVVSPDDGRVSGRVGALVEPGREMTDWDREVLGAAARLAGLASERRRNDLEVRQQALYDPMSGLPRRGLFIDRVAQALRRSTPTDLAVIFVQLVELHLINTSYGIEAGDAAVKQSARRIEALIDGQATVARFGGDEFAILVNRDDAEPLTRRIQEAFVPHWELKTVDGVVSFQPHVLAGVAHADPADDAQGLCRKAQSALRWAHQPASDSTVVYDDARRQGSVERLTLRGDLQRCVTRGELLIEYQPKLDLASGEIAGCEALVRWHHPTHGMLRPDQFIALAEESGVIVDIGEWVLAEAVRTAAQWRRDGVIRDDFLMAVNMSARQLWSPVYGDHVGETLEREGWPPEQLSLELTETLLVSNYDELLIALGGLKGLGVQLAADDFGTGYSALSYLDELPLDILKVDKGFVARLRGDGGGSVVATGVVSMAKQLQLRTCGEGVETREQLAGLRALGCDWAQGYLIARPISADRFATLAAGRPSW